MTFEIGQKIKHGPAYAMTCSERFEDDYDEATMKHVRRSEPTPLFLSGESWVVGLRMAIVGEYRYKPERVYRDDPSDCVPASATGKREECLVCVRELKPFKPYLVRKKDVIV